MLNEYGNIFNIHAHAFIVDANATNSPSIKAFKAALSEIKTEIIDVSPHFQFEFYYFEDSKIVICQFFQYLHAIQNMEKQLTKNVL